MDEFDAIYGVADENSLQFQLFQEMRMVILLKEEKKKDKRINDFIGHAFEDLIKVKDARLVEMGALQEVEISDDSVKSESSSSFHYISVKEEEEEPEIIVLSSSEEEEEEESSESSGSDYNPDSDSDEEGEEEVFDGAALRRAARCLDFIPGYSSEEESVSF